MVAKQSISVLALCAQLMLYIALCSDGAEGSLEKNWRQCVYKNLMDQRDTGLIKVCGFEHCLKLINANSCKGNYEDEGKFFSHARHLYRLN